MIDLKGYKIVKITREIHEDKDVYNLYVIPNNPVKSITFTGTLTGDGFEFDK